MTAPRKIKRNRYYNQMIKGDCLKVMSYIPDNSVDLGTTDPPYRINYMGKDWDRALPQVAIFKELKRVLKPGGFLFCMSSPRQDVLFRMIAKLEKAGFIVNFSPIYWSYSSGFPKIRRLRGSGNEHLDSAYVGCQLKPAVEVILIAMKPCEEKTMTAQAHKNGKAVTFMDECRIPYREDEMKSSPTASYDQNEPEGRFPSNLLVSDNSLDGGETGPKGRFFDLNIWWEKKLNLLALPPEVSTGFPFLTVPKPSKKEKEAGLDHLKSERVSDGRKKVNNTAYLRDATLRKNTHPTVKPVRLMSYLITMASREGDLVLDPFAGSGTTCIASKLLNRRHIGIEREPEYYQIAVERIKNVTSLN